MTALMSLVGRAVNQHEPGTSTTTDIPTILDLIEEGCERKA